MNVLKLLLNSDRGIYGSIAAACLGLMLAAFFFEYVLHLDPCPLCMVQRYIMSSIGILAFIAFLYHSPQWIHFVYSVFLMDLALLGAAVAGRQVWLQSLPPDKVPACGADFNFIVENFPFMQALEMLWRGSGDCAKVEWQFLGLSIAGWSLIWFVFFAVLSIYQLVRHVRMLRMTVSQS